MPPVLDRVTSAYSQLVAADNPTAQRARTALRGAALRASRATYGRDRFFLPIREDLPELLNRRGLLGTGYEVGVRDGEFSELILSGWKGAKLVSVDPWREAAPDEYVDLANVEQQRQDQRYEDTRRRLASFGERSEVWREYSVRAAEQVATGSADFVYIDARHDYASVKEDLEAWFDKVRPGGVLAGHDYVDGVFPDGIFGVRSAVDEFFAARGLRVAATPLDPPWPTWVVTK